MRKRNKYTKELLEPIVKQACSFAEVARMVGVAVSGGNHRLLKAHIRRFNLDTTHFTGQGWSKGRRAETTSGLRSVSQKLSLPDTTVFSENAPPISGSRLRKRLLAKGWIYACSICGIRKWLNKPLTLHVDHINGTHNDNRYENLRFLCPNCHQQTDTWGNKSVHT